MTVAIIQLIIFIAYILYYTVKAKAILPSISDSWYFLKDLKPAKDGFFVAFTFLIGGLNFIHGDGDPFKPISQGMFIISGLSLGVVGIASEFKKGNVEKFHFGGAVGAIALSAVGLCLSNPWLWIGFGISALITAFIRWKKIPNVTFWDEVNWFLFIIFGLIFSYGWSPAFVI